MSFLLRVINGNICVHGWNRGAGNEPTIAESSIRLRAASIASGVARGQRASTSGLQSSGPMRRALGLSGQYGCES